MTQRRIATHEAAHVVMAIRMGLRFDYATIERHDDILGHVHFNIGEIEMTQREYFEARICIVLAGHTGEYALKRDLSDDYLHIAGDTGNFEDLCHVDEVLDQMFENVGDVSGERAAYLDWLHRRTKNMLLERPMRRAMKAIADLLIREKAVSYGAAQAVYVSAHAPKRGVVAGLNIGERQ